MAPFQLFASKRQKPDYMRTLDNVFSSHVSRKIREEESHMEQGNTAGNNRYLFRLQVGWGALAPVRRTGAVPEVAAVIVPAGHAAAAAAAADERGSELQGGRGFRF